MTVVRGDNASVESYEMWLPPDQVTLRPGRARRRPERYRWARAALELLRIAAGIPRYGQDIRERDLPQETEQQRALHFSKGCYIGQEIVERIRSRGNVHRKFTGFEVQGALPAVGTKIQAGRQRYWRDHECLLPCPLPTASGPWRWVISGAKSRFRASNFK